MTEENPGNVHPTPEPEDARAGDHLEGHEPRTPGSKRRSNAQRRLTRRAQKLEAELRALATDIFRQVHGGDPSALDQSRTLGLSLPLAEGNDQAATLYAQLKEQTREWDQQTKGFSAGHVYCYRCAAHGCVHAVPPAPGMVFSGYSPTGVPQWADLVQVLLAARHERVDLLYEERPSTVALFMPGRDLKSQLLHTFGRASKTYDILGQVVCGYFRPPAGMAERLALTIQVVEWRGEFGRFELDLNLIGLDPEAAVLYLAEHERLRRAMERARRRIADIERRVRPSKPRSPKNVAPLREVPQVIRGLVQDLERQGRQGVRRTIHAEERGAQRRPVHMAIEDLRKAGPEDFFFDEHRKTLVVLGAKHRVHAFTLEGRHATSFSLDSASVDRRVRRGRWRSATPDERQQLLEAVARQR
jgi:hypothetical protein